VTAKHREANAELARVNRLIESHLRGLALAYAARRGMCNWAPDGTIDHAWCVLCGKHVVQPSDGVDTCETCRIQIV